MDYYTQELGMQGSMTQQDATRRYGNTLQPSPVLPTIG